MGRSITPTFRVEIRNHSRDNWRVYSAWDTKSYGRPNDANCENWRKLHNQSFQPGGVNAHVAQGTQVVPHFSHVRVVRQATGEVVAVAIMPMFEVV